MVVTERDREEVMDMEKKSKETDPPDRYRLSMKINAQRGYKCTNVTLCERIKVWGSKTKLFQNFKIL